MTKQSLIHWIEMETKSAGLLVTNLVESLQADAFGNCHVTGQLGPLAFRFVRERGQDWLELGPMDAKPTKFYFFDDIEIALGWKTINQVLDMPDVEPFGDVLKRIASRWSEITRILSGNASSIGWKRVAKSADERGKAFAARLR